MATFAVIEDRAIPIQTLCHSQFVKILPIFTGRDDSESADLNINYSYACTPLGEVLISSTSRGLFSMEFPHPIEDSLMNPEAKQIALERLRKSFPNYNFVPDRDAVQSKILDFIDKIWSRPAESLLFPQITLHIPCTQYRLRVWQKLLDIPFGRTISYGRLASDIDNPKAQRSVGTAVGRNQVAFFIPCHRIVKSTGETGAYRWGGSRKKWLIDWESSLLDRVP